MIAEHAIDWTTPWREKGRKEGRLEGEARGRQKGEAELLLRQLNRLYGPLPAEIEQRVRRADADKLLEWGERVVAADSLDEVFSQTRCD